VKDLYIETYIPPKKVIEESIRRWKYLPYSWIGSISIMKIAIVPKAIYMFNEILIKIPMAFPTEIEKSTIKFMWKHRRPGINKAILCKKSNAEGITIPK
jgi:hypothetical protein